MPPTWALASLRGRVRTVVSFDWGVGILLAHFIELVELNWCVHLTLGGLCVSPASHRAPTPRSGHGQRQGQEGR
jgi:hypothetical protein